MPMSETKSKHEEALDSALDLMRRLPPQLLESNLTTLTKLMPDHTEDLLSMIDQPLKIQLCPKTSSEFLLCDYNRAGDSFRSPLSNEYVPRLAEGEGIYPPNTLRKLEIELNDAFSIYHQMYYDHGAISSVYLWDLTEERDSTVPETPRRQILRPFAAAVLIKKADESDTEKCKGGWDAIHVLEIVPKSGTAPVNPSSDGVLEAKQSCWSYKLTTTILLYLLNEGEVVEHVDLSGNVSRQMTSVMHVIEDHDHIANIGRLVEEMENKMRSLLQEIYFGRTKDVVNRLRSGEGVTVAE